MFDFQGFLRVAHPKNTQYEYNGLVVESDFTVSEGGGEKKLCAVEIVFEKNVFLQVLECVLCPMRSWDLPKGSNIFMVNMIL